jgi:hypothetical protein
MWHLVQSISDVPTDRDLRLAVMDRDDGMLHQLVFPCRRSGLSWINAKTRRLVEVRPTHWQEWHIDRADREWPSPY